MSEPRFVHLRVHSDYSMIDGLAKTGPLVKKAAALGMPALAITDFTNLCGLVKFYGTAHGAGMVSDILNRYRQGGIMSLYRHP